MARSSGKQRKIRAEHGHGSIAKSACTLDGDMPALPRAFFPAGEAEPGFPARKRSGERHGALGHSIFEPEDVELASPYAEV